MLSFDTRKPILSPLTFLSHKLIFFFNSTQLQVSINPIDSQQVTPTEKLVRAKPGDEVTVRVKAKPLSYFGLLVVDQASRALGSNDITQKEVGIALYA